MQKKMIFRREKRNFTKSKPRKNIRSAAISSDTNKQKSHNLIMYQSDN